MARLALARLADHNRKERCPTMRLELLHNPVASWGLAILVLVAATLAMYATRQFFMRRLNAIGVRSDMHIRDFVTDMICSTHLLFMLAIGAYLGSLLLNLPAQREQLLWRLAVCAILIQVAFWGDTGVKSWRTNFGQGRADRGTGNGMATTTTVSFMARMAVWVIVLLMLLDNLGFNITTLVASLGIGGIAVALAVQNILGDLFASLSIALDKPFVVGDFIIVGNELGTVELIGLKTTRVRSLGGEQIIFSNAEMLRSRIHNHQRMQTRRAAFIIRVTYQSSEAQLRGIPATVGAIVRAQQHASFERAHFSGLGESSLDFEVVYWIDTPDYNVFMDTQQAIFLALFRQFSIDGIEFAHPVRTILQQPARPA
jgi:small-conductance mechanosensitive channel